MLYNVDFEIAGIIILLIMYYFLHTQYSQQSETTNAFRRFILIMILTEVMDVVTAYTISYAAAIPNIVNMLLNTFYIGLTLYLQFAYVEYVSSYIRRYNKQSYITIVCNYVGGIYSLMLVLNFFTGIIFDFSPEGKFIRGPLNIIEYLIPSVFIYYSVVIVLKNTKSFMTKQAVSIILLAVLSTGGCFFQFFFRRDILLSMFSLTIGALFCMLALETPDYQKLLMAMDELSAAKEALEKADKAKTEFITNMSHEIRTPINAVLGYNELILKRTKEEAIVEYSRNAQVAGRALLSMVNDILDYTNIDDGTLNIARVEYSVTSMINDMLINIEYNTRRKGLDCKISIDDNLPMLLLGDAVRINQIVNNIVATAVNFTRDGSVELIINWEPSTENHGYLCVEVNDTGVGMPQEAVDMVMAYYESEEMNSKKELDQFGFVLSIILNLLKLMNADMKIESELGKGSSFKFRIRQRIIDATPIRLEVKDYSLEDESEINVYAPEARVLLADDNKMNLDLITGLLKDTGVSFNTAVNGVEVIQKVREHEYDLIFMDHMMPVMDGVEAFREINRLKLCPETPIIVLTANAVAGSREKYLKEGFDAYLSKPVTQKQLLKSLYDFLPYDKIIEDHVYEASVEKMPMSVLERFDFLNCQIGLAYCADSLDFYLEMLQSYVDNDRSKELEALYGQENWKDYQITVHALKSTSMSIGAEEMSEKAKKLEFAARDNDLDYIRQKHEIIMKEYQELIQKIQHQIQTISLTLV